MRRIIDISPSLKPGIAVFPGDAPFEHKDTFSIGPDCPVNVTAISMTTHCGAHADAPLHYAEEGASVDQLPLGDFIGPARVIDARGKEPLCRPSDIEPSLNAVPSRVLLRLVDEWDPMVWRDDFRSLSPQTVELLHQKGVRLIGVDVPSVDPADSKDLPAHQIFLRHDIRNLEGLVLSWVTPGDYNLVALPLKLEGLDAAPVRAILINRENA